MTRSTERAFRVEGMTCEHCEASVREEVEGIPGVEVVAVDRASGRLLVRGESLDDGPIRDAVAAAGYRLVTAPSGTASGEE